MQTLPKNPRVAPAKDNPKVTVVEVKRKKASLKMRRCLMSSLSDGKSNLNLGKNKIKIIRTKLVSSVPFSALKLVAWLFGFTMFYSVTSGAIQTIWAEVVYLAWTTYPETYSYEEEAWTWESVCTGKAFVLVYQIDPGQFFSWFRFGWPFSVFYAATE